MTLRILIRTWLVSLVGCLPLLALLLVPQLLRSRAGNEQLLLLGTGLLLLLLVAAFLAAPVLSAVAAPEAGRWDRGRAWRSAGALWRSRRGAAVGALVAGVAVYALGQVLAYGVGEVVPPFADNPAHATDPAQPAWIVHYPAYVLQALVIYATTTLAVAVYATLLRRPSRSTANYLTT
ncbi:hypothetical protein [Microbacterium paraoxydans]|uniref:hypothetical protein n=1 Tax=Microbacterium paraoxydans TaxID=199592 RepID=UPI003D72B4C3